MPSWHTVWELYLHSYWLPGFWQAVCNSEWNLVFWTLSLPSVYRTMCRVQSMYWVSDMACSVQDTKTMGKTQDFSNIKCNVLSSTQYKSADLDIMHRIPHLWPNTVQTKHRSCQYCLYHWMPFPLVAICVVFCLKQNQSQIDAQL